VASLLVLALIAGIMAWQQRNQARARQTDADAQRLGAQALASGDLALSLLLARQAVALRDTPQTRGDLLAALLKSPAAISVIQGVGRSTDLAISPDGQTLAMTDERGDVHFIDARTGLRIAPTEAVKEGTLPNFDHSGERMATSGDHASIR